ncbi:hypothetical protein BDM02DRAFT_3109256 [Thelephora ganbajun]|uniref:Uncharacterized protein n=1 Tax=Thelephora ganbajun TaxID=370292 RepID=A0ACB6ZS96_THEGA|nr:hypothetical protein BDM02DRAFT_3109256 [Thelephora ganbajun]
MSTLRPEATLTIPDLFRALDAKIAEQISLTRSGRRGQNPFSHRVLDELYAGAKHLLVRLEELKNSHQPVQQLPHDIIVEIATYLNPRAPRGGDYQPLMAMSQVCRYWRQTLISNQESWCFISGEYLDLIPLFLERSGSYPLEIDLADTQFSYAVHHIGPHANRIAVLRCDLEEANNVSLPILSQLDYSPNLRTFSIKTRRPPTVAPEVIEMPLVSGDMSNLRTLELLPFPVIPQFVQFKNLVNLQLDVIYSTLTVVLDLLAANPSLEKVRLLGNFEDDEDARATGSISMRRLRFLTVERCTPCLFLEKLTFPRNARIFIRYNLISHLIPFAYTLPQSMGKYVNLQGLASLHVLMAFQSDTYIDAIGPNGSVAIQFMDLQDASPVCNAIASLSAAEITKLGDGYPPSSRGD